jgi:hypothetical protein
MSMSGSSHRVFRILQSSQERRAWVRLARGSPFVDWVWSWALMLGAERQDRMGGMIGKEVELGGGGERGCQQLRWETMPTERKTAEAKSICRGMNERSNLRRVWQRHDCGHQRQ